MHQCLRRYLSITCSCLFLGLSPVTQVLADYQELSEKYREISEKLQQNSYGIPVVIQSSIEAMAQRGDVYGIIYHSFDEVKNAFSHASNWCDIAPLHLNIKACTFQKLNGDYQLTFYSGRKFFEKPEDTYQLIYRYHLDNKQKNYTRVTLTVEQGPLGTSDYKIITQAVPLDNSTTFIHFSYSYQQGFWTRMAMKTYLATIGRDKIGFTVIGNDTRGKAVYVDGIRGVIERNAVRYYYAIQAYLATRNKEPGEIHIARLNSWFDLTEKHHQQLYEMEKKEYLEYKIKEHAEQTRLQQEQQ